MAKVLIKTTEGDIKVRLYDETPCLLYTSDAADE